MPVLASHLSNRAFASIVLRAVLLAALWWVLTGGAAGSWWLGAVVIGIALAASLRLQPPGRLRLALATGPALLLFFLIQSVRGGMQVAGMALRPRLQLRPGLVEIRLRLADEPAQIFLASLLNLLPGTLSVGIDGNRLCLHVLDVRLPVGSEVRAAEAYVARLFRQELT